MDNIAIRVDELEKQVKALMKMAERNCNLPPIDRYLTVEDVADLFRLSPSTINRRFIKKGLLHPIKIPMPHSFRGFVYRIPGQDIMKFIATCKDTKLFDLERLTCERNLKYDPATKKILDYGQASSEVIARRHKHLAQVLKTRIIKGRKAVLQQLEDSGVTLDQDELEDYVEETYATISPGIRGKDYFEEEVPSDPNLS